MQSKLDSLDIEKITLLAAKIRAETIRIAETRGPTHIASALSLIEILASLYGNCVDVELIRLRSPSRDRVILSKAHAAMALYATLAELNIISTLQLNDYGTERLPVHPVQGLTPGIELTCGSLGNGLGVGIGLALAAALDRRPSRTFVILGDGECQEGSVWESAMLAPKLACQGLTVIIDCNGLQQNSLTPIELNPEILGRQFSNFGWRVIEVDGHSLACLCEALRGGTEEAPTAVIARTIKGRGVALMENSARSHFLQLKTE